MRGVEVWYLYELIRTTRRVAVRETPGFTLRIRELSLGGYPETPMVFHSHVERIDPCLLSVEHIVIRNGVYNKCTDLDNSFDDRFMDFVDLTVDSVVMEPIAETDAFLSDHLKILDSVLAIKPVNVNAIVFYSTMNKNDIFDVNELLHDNNFELSLDSAADSHVCVDFEIEIVQNENFIELELNFDLTQFSENFICNFEAGSCSICTEIGYVLQPDSKLITDAINCVLNENAGAVIKESMVVEEDCIGTALSKPEVFILVPHTQQLPLEGELLLLLQ
ncbi:hypothetical protein LR48_Vigan07g179300 [Vigna angularis]|uniref:Uncharacterized protein n=1 Tax=Phaseolus angularis TaxID=3914 RepID=A0A0L9UZY2_PHAAN|nr:hypothetical protein LR48_Vigan07g179300 [Vigna angularis]